MYLNHLKETNVKFYFKIFVQSHNSQTSVQLFPFLFDKMYNLDYQLFLMYTILWRSTKLKSIDNKDFKKVVLKTASIFSISALTKFVLFAIIIYHLSFKTTTNININYGLSDKVPGIFIFLV